MPVTMGFLVILCFSSCSYDNYDAPQITLTGRIVYNKTAINIGSQQVFFNLYQLGYEKRTPIEVQVAPDGSYNALLFKGDYQIVFPQGQGPFVLKGKDGKPDTISVNVNGNTVKDIEVMPYYMISNSQFSANGRRVSANLNLTKVILDPDIAQDIEYVALCVGKTSFPDVLFFVAKDQINGSDIVDLSNINFDVDVPQLTPNQNYVFARIGVKIKNVDDLLYSELEKLQLN